MIASLSNTYIKFPTTHIEQREVMNYFYNIAGFTGVIGTIDCTHIRIKSPGVKMQNCLEIERAISQLTAKQ